MNYLKLYDIVDTELKFKDNVEVIGSSIEFPSYLTKVDFNNVKHINVAINLGNTNIKSIDLKNVLTIKNLFLPKGCKIKEDLYWAVNISYITGPIPKHNINSSRLWKMNMYESRPLIYLSGTIKGYLDLRDKQRSKLNNINYGVYDPGNHITFGNKVAEDNPNFVYELDMLAIKRSDILLFDLNNLSAGTSAELGLIIAKNYHIDKRVIVFYEEPITNFFIKGLINNKYVEHYKSLDDFINNERKVK